MREGEKTRGEQNGVAATGYLNKQFSTRLFCQRRGRRIGTCARPFVTLDSSRGSVR
jgi:hypothetical protein